ncbi:MAG: hypothetical protein IJ421_03900 [Prevotella sp.]|nr:hypothetical protein [Prevotella sp.]MBQ8628600.1 hypothetical protein [Prevotella sp.]
MPSTHQSYVIDASKLCNHFIRAMPLQYDGYVLTPSWLFNRTHDYYLIALPWLCHHTMITISCCRHGYAIPLPLLCHHAAMAILSHRQSGAIITS